MPTTVLLIEVFERVLFKLLGVGIEVILSSGTLSIFNFLGTKSDLESEVERSGSGFPDYDSAGLSFDDSDVVRSPFTIEKIYLFIEKSSSSSSSNSYCVSSSF